MMCRQPAGSGVEARALAALPARLGPSSSGHSVLTRLHQRNADNGRPPKCGLPLVPASPQQVSCMKSLLRDVHMGEGLASRRRCCRCCHQRCRHLPFASAGFSLHFRWHSSMQQQPPVPPRRPPCRQTADTAAPSQRLQASCSSRRTTSTTAKAHGSVSLPAKAAPPLPSQQQPEQLEQQQQQQQQPSQLQREQQEQQQPDKPTPAGWLSGRNIAFGGSVATVLVLTVFRRELAPVRALDSILLSLLVGAVGGRVTCSCARA